jgi:hypothetical protein
MKPWMQLVGIIVVGVLLVWCLGRGGLDAETKAELDAFRKNAPIIEAQRQALVAAITANIEKRAALWEDNAVLRRQSDYWRGQARLSLSRADVHNVIADSGARLLATAAGCQDSVSALLLERNARRSECAALRITIADQDTALAKADTAQWKADTARRVADSVIVDFRRLRAADSTELGVARPLIDRLARAARGCRVPLIGVPCPVGVASYDLDTRGLHAGVGLPLTSWLTVSVTTRVVSRRDP